MIAVFEKRAERVPRAPRPLRGASSELRARTAAANAVSAPARSLGRRDDGRDPRLRCDGSAPTRVVIDSLIGLRAGARARRSARTFASRSTGMVGSLTGLGVTVLMTAELTDSYTELRFSPHEISFLADGIILQRYVELGGHLRRMMFVAKMRGLDHSKEMRLYEVRDEGIFITESLADYEGYCPERHASCLSNTTSLVDRAARMVAVDHGHGQTSTRSRSSAQCSAARAMRAANEQLVLTSMRADAARAKQAKASERREGRVPRDARHELRNPFVADLERTRADGVALAGRVRRRAGDDRATGEAHGRGSSMTCSTCLASRAARSVTVSRAHQACWDLVRTGGRAREAASIDAKRHTFIVGVPPRPAWSVNVDPRRLTQVIANLLANAGKYTHRR